MLLKKPHNWALTENPGYKARYVSVLVKLKLIMRMEEGQLPLSLLVCESKHHWNPMSRTNFPNEVVEPCLLLRLCTIS